MGTSDSWNGFTRTGNTGETPQPWFQQPSEQPAEQPGRHQTGEQPAPETSGVWQIPLRRANAASPEPARERPSRATQREAPAFGPTPPAGPSSGRTSYGVTEGPISGTRPDQVSSAAPAPAPVSPAMPRQRQAPGPAPVSPATPRERVPDQPVTDWGSVTDWLTTGPQPGSAQPGAQWTDSPRAESRMPELPRLDPERKGPEHVGEFLSGPGREIRPHRAGRTAESAPAQAGPPRRSRLTVAAAVVLSLVVLLGGAVAGVAYFGDENSSLTKVLRLGSGDSDGKVATAPLGGRQTASFELVAATTKVTVRMQDLPDELYRITSAGDSGTAPSPVLTENRLQLLLSPDGDGSSGVVEVVLSSKVTWEMRFIGGADEQIINLAGGRISKLELAGGSRRVDLALPAPTGTVPITVTGAIEDFSVASPDGNPVRFRVDSGAQTVAAGDKTLRDVKPGSTLTPKDWKVANRYDVSAASRITLLSVKTAG